LKETANKNNEISLYALARGGTSDAPEAHRVSASLAAEMINASGLGPYTRPELTRMLADKQVSFSFFASQFLRGFQGSSSTGDLKTLMEMIHLGITQPGIDPDAVTVLLDRMRTRLAQELENPDRFFSRELTKTIYGNPFFHPLEMEDLDKADIGEALEFFRLCQNPSDYTFVFTGSIDFDAMRALTETYLASIPVPSAKAFNEWTEVDFMRPADLRKEIRKGREERSVVYMAWFTPMPFTDDDFASSAALDEYLNIVLNDEIRESLGGVYSISFWSSLSPAPTGELSGGIYFVCNPERAEELADAAEALVRETARGKIDNDVLIKSREALAQGHERSVQSNLYIAQSYANSAVIYHSPLNRMDKRPYLYQTVSAQDLQYIAMRLLERGMVRLILYPEAQN